MSKLIKDWGELSKISPNDKYKIEVEDCCGWIVPLKETNETIKNYFDHHIYLSTHTFYGLHYKESTRILQKFGFDVEIDNWDKEVKK